MSIKGSGADSAKVRAARAAASCVLMVFAFETSSPRHRATSLQCSGM